MRHWSIAAPVRLACLIHAASVRSEPGSNSPIKKSNSQMTAVFYQERLTLSYCVTTVISASFEASLKPLTRAHRTIQHFSKNTPQYKRIISFAAPLPCTQAHERLPRVASHLVSGWYSRILPWNPPVRVRPLKQPLKGPLGKDGAFNIASILCLSMLFSKNSGVLTRKPLRRTLPQRLTTPSRSVRASQ